MLKRVTFLPGARCMRDTEKRFVPSSAPSRKTFGDAATTARLLLLTSRCLCALSRVLETGVVSVSRGSPKESSVGRAEKSNGRGNGKTNRRQPPEPPQQPAAPCGAAGSLGAD